MLPPYSLLLTIAFIAMSPLFILRRQKYASGFRQRLGNYPEFRQDGRKVIWLHAVSVGEANAARPLVDKLLAEFPDHRVVISTTTKTGQELAQNIFRDKADTVFYFPFDWKFSVKKALDNYKPSLVLLMETEIWPRFIYEAKKVGARVAIVNGRVSEKSFQRYSYVRGFVSRVLEDVDLALMQGEKDAERVRRLGIDGEKISIPGNLKFEQPDNGDDGVTEYLKDRFGFEDGRPLIIAASTHDPEEEWVVDAFKQIRKYFDARLMIAPRHPERFDSVTKILRDTDLSFARRSDAESGNDKNAHVILLDSIGELRTVYPLADIVFVGGSLIPHGGQSVIEPAAAGKAVITGPYTHNFADVVREFVEHDALIELREGGADDGVPGLVEAFEKLLVDTPRREELGQRAFEVMQKNRGATEKTVSRLKSLVSGRAAA